MKIFFFVLEKQFSSQGAVEVIEKLHYPAEETTRTDKTSGFFLYKKILLFFKLLIDN